MTGGSLPVNVKFTSALRRIPPLQAFQYRPVLATEGDVCAFELPPGALPITVEAPSGRPMAVTPGDTFLATPGYRESTRWVSGRIPAGGLIPGDYYWVLAESGVVGELTGDPPLETGHLARVQYLGAVCRDSGETVNIRQFAVPRCPETGRNMPVYLLLGTSGHVGKTTAGLAVLRALRMQGHARVIALKATGTPSVAEIAIYQDFGAEQAFDCIDFGLPTTYPSGRGGISDIFVNALDFCCSLPAEALMVECGGDVLGANVPEFLACLKARLTDLKVILAAADALGAIGAKRVLAEIGFTISLITGPCTDTPAMRERTQALCGISAVNMARGLDQGKQSYLSGVVAFG